MKFSYVAKDRTIFIRSDRPVAGKLISDVRAAVQINRRIFGAISGSVKVVVCATPQSWKRESKYYYFPFARGLVLRNGTLVLKSIQLSKLTTTQYRKLIVHEMNHLFWLRKFGGGRSMWSPIWLIEALACDAARGEYLLSRSELKDLCKGREKDRLLSFRYRNSDITTREELIFRYSLWLHLLQYLKRQRGFSLSSLLRSIKRDRSQVALQRWFTNNLGDPPEKLLRRFIAGL